jgi:hypothetical protein
MTLLTLGLLALLALLYGLDRLLSKRAIAREFADMKAELAAMQMANEPRPSPRRPMW